MRPTSPSGRPIAALVERTVAEFGGLDIMLNNAGVALNAPLLEMSDEIFDKTMATNLRSAFIGTQLAARQMVAAGKGGVIINMSSVNALLAIPGLAAYACSKGALNQLTKVAAIELAPHNIRVVAIGPGTILTELARNAVMTDDSGASQDSRRARRSGARASRRKSPRSPRSWPATTPPTSPARPIYPDGGRLALNYTVPVAD